MAWQLMMRVTMAWEVAMTRLVTATIVANTIPRMRVALVEEADNVRDVCSVCTECPHSYITSTISIIVIRVLLRAAI